MLLDYFALGLLFFVGIVLFYGVIAIHDIPYEIAKARKHPQQDALHVAGWISLFTLHTIWPFLWIWATLYREDRGWGFLQEDPQKHKLNELISQISIIQTKLELFVNDHEKIQSIEKEFLQLSLNATNQNAKLQESLARIESEIASIKLKFIQSSASKKD